MLYFPLVVGIFLVAYAGWAILWLKNAESERIVKVPVALPDAKGRSADAPFPAQPTNKFPK